MDNGTSVSMKFINKIEGQGKLEKYETRLQSIQKLLKDMPRNVNIGGTTNNTEGFNKALKKSNELLINLNKNMSKFRQQNSGNIKDLSSQFNNFNKTLEKNKENSLSLLKVVTSVPAQLIALEKIPEKISSKMMELTASTSNYLEDLNLMSVAFKSGYKDAKKYTDTMSDMYGLSEDTVVRSLGMFKELSNSMGLDNQVGTVLSESMTHLALDISSLYNTTFERSVSVLESALAGQTKPIRSLTGADITQSTLQLTLDDAGINRTIDSLSYAEKRLIIVTSLIRQLEDSQNDYGRTAEQVANQMRIFNEQSERFARAVGSLVYKALEQVLPVLNGVLMTLTAIVSAIAKLFGYEEEVAEVEDTTSNFQDLTGSLDDAYASAKKLKQGLRGFDKLNVITTPSSGSGAGAGGIDSRILDEFNKANEEYKNKLKEIELRAKKIKEHILGWLGFTEDENGELKWTGNWVNVIHDVLAGGALAGGAVGIGILGAVKNIDSILGGFKKLIFPDLKKSLNTEGAEKGLEAATSKAKSLSTALKVAALAGGVLVFAKVVNAWAKDLKETNKLTLWGASEDGRNYVNEYYKGMEDEIDEYVSSGKAQENSEKIAESLNKGLRNNLFNISGISQALDTGAGKIAKLTNSGTYKNYKSMITSIASEYAKNVETTAETLKHVKLTDEEYKSIAKQIVDMNDELGDQLKLYDKNSDEYKAIDEAMTQGSKLRKKIHTEYMSESYRTTQDTKKNLQDLSKYIKDGAFKGNDIFGFNKETEEAKKTIDNLRGNVIDTSNTVANVVKSKNEESANSFTSFIDNAMSKAKQYKEESEKNTNSIFDVFKRNAIDSAEQMKRSYDDSIARTSNNITTKIPEALKEIAKNKFNIDFDADPSKAMNTLTTFLQNISKKMQTTFSVFDVLKNVTNVKTVTNALSNWYTNARKILGFANGGLPPVGQLFVANEKGPELVGQIGGQSFVANQNQMMDLLDKKIGTATSSFSPTIVVQVGNKEIARQVLTDLQDMATANGKAITIR